MLSALRRFPLRCMPLHPSLRLRATPKFFVVCHRRPSDFFYKCSPLTEYPPPFCLFFCDVRSAPVFYPSLSIRRFLPPRWDVHRTQTARRLVKFPVGVLPPAPMPFSGTKLPQQNQFYFFLSRMFTSGTESRVTALLIDLLRGGGSCYPPRLRSEEKMALLRVSRAPYSPAFTHFRCGIVSDSDFLTQPPSSTSGMSHVPCLFFQAFSLIEL